MSENTTRRRSLHPSSKRRKRRNSTMNISSIGGYNDDEDSMLKMFETDEFKEVFEINNNEEGGDDSGDARKRRGREVEMKNKADLLSQKIKNCKEIIENIKNQDWKMSKKMIVHTKARMFVEKFEGKLSQGTGYRHRGSQIMKQFMRTWTNWMASLVPWEMKIRRIESHFGSVVASYFVFLRWLLWMSLWLAVMPTIFIILPELLLGDAYGSSERKKIPEDELDTAYDLKTIWNAEGIVKYSIIFYGYYDNSKTIAFGYRLPLAYLLTNMAAFAYSFVVVLKRMANNFRQNRMSSKEDEFTFACKIFTEWDYMIGSHETAMTKHASIATTFKEAIMEEQEKVREGNKWLTLSLRVLANVIILVLLALSAYVVQLFVERSRQLELRKRNDPNYESGFWEENELTFIMTMISTIFPPVLEVLSPLENFHPRKSLRLMLGRIFILNLLNLYTLFIALYNKQNDLMAYLKALEQNVTYQSNCSSDLGHQIWPNISTTILPILDDGNNSTTASPGYVTNGTTSGLLGNMTSDPDCVNKTVVPALVKELCWETMIGQEVFKLTVMDTVFVLGQILLQDVIRTYFVRYCNSLWCWDIEKHFPEYPEFKTAENLLALISNQGVIWLGTFFNPGLPLLNLVKLFALMYVRYWTAMVYTVPEERIFRASRSNNFYYALLLIMLFLCMLPPLFAIVNIEPSPHCGPFSGQSRMYDVLIETIQTELPATVTSTIRYLFSPGIILPVFMLLGVFMLWWLLLRMTIYYLISVTRSLRDANGEMRVHLEYERTEGRRKVYAMAEAKHIREQAKHQGWKDARTQLGHNGQPETSRGVTAADNFVFQGGQTKEAVNKQTRTISDATKRTSGAPLVVIKGKQPVKTAGLVTRMRNKQVAVSAFKKSLVHNSGQKKETRKDEGINDKSKHVHDFMDRRAGSMIEHQKDTRQQARSRGSNGESIREDEIFRHETTQPFSVKSDNFKRQNGLTKLRTNNQQFRSKLSNIKMSKTAGLVPEKTAGRVPSPFDREKILREMTLEDTNLFNQSRSGCQVIQKVRKVGAENITKNVRRRLSSSSMVDESGHLKPYNDLTDNDSGDEEEFSDDVVSDGDEDINNFLTDDNDIVDYIDESEENNDEMEWSYWSKRNTNRTQPISRKFFPPSTTHTVSKKTVPKMSTQARITRKSNDKKVSARIQIVDESGKDIVSKNSFGASRTIGRPYIQRTASNSYLVVPEIKVEDFSLISERMKRQRTPMKPTNTYSEHRKYPDLYNKRSSVQTNFGEQSARSGSENRATGHYSTRSNNGNGANNSNRQETFYAVKNRGTGPEVKAEMVLSNENRSQSYGQEQPAAPPKVLPQSDTQFADSKIKQSNIRRNHAKRITKTGIRTNDSSRKEVMLNSKKYHIKEQRTVNNRQLDLNGEHDHIEMGTTNKMAARIYRNSNIEQMDKTNDVIGRKESLSSDELVSENEHPRTGSRLHDATWAIMFENSRGNSSDVLKTTSQELKDATYNQVDTHKEQYENGRHFIYNDKKQTKPQKLIWEQLLQKRPEAHSSPHSNYAIQEMHQRYDKEDEIELNVIKISNRQYNAEKTGLRDESAAQLHVAKSRENTTSRNVIGVLESLEITEESVKPDKYSVNHEENVATASTLRRIKNSKSAFQDINMEDGDEDTLDAPNHDDSDILESSSVNFSIGSNMYGLSRTDRPSLVPTRIGDRNTHYPDIVDYTANYPSSTNRTQHLRPRQKSVHDTSTKRDISAKHPNHNDRYTSVIQSNHHGGFTIFAITNGNLDLTADSKDDRTLPADDHVD